MHCPECRVEYRDGFTEYSDCLVPSSAGPFDPSLDLVVVLETNERIQLALAKGLLEDAGISYQDVDGFLNKWAQLQVPRDREAEAKELLELLLHAEAIPPDAGEKV